MCALPDCARFLTAHVTVQVLRKLLCALCSHGAYNHTNAEQAGSWDLQHAEKIYHARTKDAPLDRYAT